MGTNKLWFTRRGKEIRGPYPEKLITRYILLGRITETDHLSTDQNNWQLVSSLTELIPDEMKADLSIPENRERLRLARLREDERQSGDRRQYEKEVSEEFLSRRSGGERRDDETPETLRHRAIKTKTYKIIAKQAQDYRLGLLLILAMVATIIFVAVAITPSKPMAVNNCGEPAGPGVNWSNCHMEGIKLASEDLSGARLQNSFFISADLHNADLSGAEMSYANLSNTAMRSSRLSNAKLLGAVLRNADLSKADLTGANLRYAILQGADLSGADLRNADLTHAVLNGASVSNADFTGAVLDKVIWVDNSVCAPDSVGECVPLKK